MGLKYGLNILERTHIDFVWNGWELIYIGFNKFYYTWWIYVPYFACCCRAILYPGSKIIVASGNRGQSALIITDKIETLRKQYPALDKEIEKVQKNNDNIRCIYKNGSVIEAIVSGDVARGMRGNVLVCDPVSFDTYWFNRICNQVQESLCESYNEYLDNFRVRFANSGGSSFEVCA